MEPEYTDNEEELTALEFVELMITDLSVFAGMHENSPSRTAAEWVEEVADFFEIGDHDDEYHDDDE